MTWHPAMTRLRDQTGTAHRMAADGRPACGTRVFTLGGGFHTAEAAGARPCKRCGDRGQGNRDRGEESL